MFTPDEVREILGELTPEQEERLRSKTKETTSKMPPQLKSKLLSKAVKDIVCEEIINFSGNMYGFANAMVESGLANSTDEVLCKVGELLNYSYKMLIVKDKLGRDVEDADDPELLELYAKEFHSNMKEDFECI